jgi:hypothetical protein
MRLHTVNIRVIPALVPIVGWNPNSGRPYLASRVLPKNPIPVLVTVSITLQRFDCPIFLDDGFGEGAVDDDIVEPSFDGFRESEGFAVRRFANETGDSVVVLREVHEEHLEGGDSGEGGASLEVGKPVVGIRIFTAFDFEEGVHRLLGLLNDLT